MATFAETNLQAARIDETGRNIKSSRFQPAAKRSSARLTTTTTTTSPQPRLNSCTHTGYQITCISISLRCLICPCEIHSLLVLIPYLMVKRSQPSIHGRDEEGLCSHELADIATTAPLTAILPLGSMRCGCVASMHHWLTPRLLVFDFESA